VSATGRLAALAELARISNLPTVVSNTLVGVSIGAAATGASPPWSAALGLGTAIALFYVAGMVLNDAADASIDRRDRPGRPIPSGRVALGSAYGLAAAGLAAGLLMVAAYGLPAFGFALGLVVAIVAYDMLHRRSAGTVLLMGLCRGLVYLVAAAGVVWPFDGRIALWLASALASYTVGVSLAARGEATGSAAAGRRIAPFMPLLALAPVLVLRPREWIWSVLTAVLLVAWSIVPLRALWQRPPRPVHAVLAWLAGICLVDAWFLTLLDRPLLALAAGVCFVVTVLGHRRILGT
jgi:4-hydroxybenzoate polyprenyltransferase